MTKKKVLVLAVLSVAGAVTAGLLDDEAAGFMSLFSEGGNIAGLLVWSAGFFAIGGALLLLWAVAHSALTQLTG